MRIGIISQWYPPEPGMFIPASLAAELAARGHQVRVLTGFPNYPEGKVYPGYRQRWCEDSMAGGVTVRRVPLYTSHDSSSVRRAANYLSFAATSSMAAARYLAQADALYIYHPPATAFTAAALLRLLRQIPALLHVQDVWPESVTTSAMAPGGPAGRYLHHALGLTMHRVYEASAAIVVIAPGMRDLVVTRGAAPDKVHTVLNWADEAVFRPRRTTEDGRRAIGYRGRCTVMYAGNIGLFQNIEGAIRAAAATDCIDLVLVGSGLTKEPARTLAAELAAENVRFLEPRPPAEVAVLQAAADFQLVSLRDLPVLRGTIPSKLQTALCSGSPVIVAARGDCADLVDRHNVGLTCRPEDPPALSTAFLRAAALSPQSRAAMGLRARLVYEQHMSQRSGIDQIEKLLESAARQRGRLPHRRARASRRRPAISA